MTAEGGLSSTAISSLASDCTVNTRAPAPVNASNADAMKGSSSQMRIVQPTKLALFIGPTPRG